MNASKEEARKAIRQLNNAASMLDAIEDKKFRDEVKRCLIRVDSFLEAAEKRLPSEAAYARDKERRAKKTAKPDTGDGPESLKSLFRI